MSKTTSDPGTPIFGELNNELELPEIVVHDFDEHAFAVPEGSFVDEITESELAEVGETSAETAATEAPAEQNSAAGSEEKKAAAAPSESHAAESHAAGSRPSGTAQQAVAGKQAAKRSGGRRRKEE